MIRPLISSGIAPRGRLYPKWAASSFNRELTREMSILRYRAWWCGGVVDIRPADSGGLPRSSVVWLVRRIRRFGAPAKDGGP